MGVISHTHSHLTLLAARHIPSGVYFPYPILVTLTGLFDVTLVRRFPLETDGRCLKTLGDIEEWVKSWEGREGVVVHWQRDSPPSLALNDPLHPSDESATAPSDKEWSDVMLKVKSPWYVASAAASKLSHNSSFLLEILRSNSSLSLSSIPFAEIFRAVVHPMGDDVISQCVSILRRGGYPGPADALMTFSDSVKNGVHQLHAEFVDWGRRVRSSEEIPVTDGDSLKSGEESSEKDRVFRDAIRTTKKDLHRVCVSVGQQAGWTPQMLTAYCRGDGGCEGRGESQDEGEGEGEREAGEEGECVRGKEMLMDSLRRWAKQKNGDDVIASLLNVPSFSSILSAVTSRVDPPQTSSSSSFSSSTSSSSSSMDLSSPLSGVDESSPAVCYRILNDLPVSQFDAHPRGLSDHILQRYLPRKVFLSFVVRE